MNFLKICNGYGFEAVPESISKAVAEIGPQARKEFETWLSENSEPTWNGVFRVGSMDYYKGSRFYSNGGVAARIAHVLNEEEFAKHDPKAVILDALRDCAGADYWYNFEKDYGD